jgi:hypothetical protein
MSMFFSEADLRIVAAAVDRLIPPDELGCPGAAAKGVKPDPIK